MTTTLELPEAALTALRDYLLARAADEDQTPAQELAGLSDSVLAAYWHGYVEASNGGRAGQALHAAALSKALAAPLGAVCAETGALRAALAQSFQ